VDSLSTEQVPLCAPLLSSAHTQIGYHQDGYQEEDLQANMLSKFRPRELSKSLADALKNGSHKFEEQFNVMKFFEWVKTIIIEIIESS
jgi:hypothetical protein